MQIFKTLVLSVILYRAGVAGAAVTTPVRTEIPDAMMESSTDNVPTCTSNGGSCSANRDCCTFHCNLKGVSQQGF